MRVGLPHIAGLYRYGDWRPHMTRMVVGQVLGRQGREVVIRGQALLQPGGHLVIHVFRLGVI